MLEISVNQILYFEILEIDEMSIKKLLEQSLDRGASDLHIGVGQKPMLRIDGDMIAISNDELDAKILQAYLSEVSSAEQRKEFDEKLELDFSYELKDIARFRVNVFKQRHGMSMVFRTIPMKVWDLGQLGAPAIFRELLTRSHGLVLVTGPTGSGKSTTLAAMINEINQHEQKHILTVEDPIEFVHESAQSMVQQREVHRDTHEFKNALRAALREDPDIILVGEMRDLETIRLALTAAETGHLVFATLHTSSAPKTIDRIIDVFPAGEKDMVRTMLSESLEAVIAQKLYKKNGGGRVAAYEILTGTPAVRNLIREGKVSQMVSAMQTGAQYGMQTMDQAIAELKSSNVI